MHIELEVFSWKYIFRLSLNFHFFKETETDSCKQFIIDIWTPWNTWCIIARCTCPPLSLSCLLPRLVHATSGLVSLICGGDTRVEMVWLWRGRVWRGRWCLPFTQCTGVFLLLPDIGLLSNSGVSGMKVNAEVSARKWPQSVTGTAASGNWTKGRCSLGADLNPALIWGFLWNFPKAVTRNPANRQMLTCHSGIAFEWWQPTGVCVVWKWSLHPCREGRAPLVAFYRKPLVLVSVRSHILPGDLVV